MLLITRTGSQPCNLVVVFDYNMALFIHSIKLSNFMKQVAKYIIQKRGINFYIAVKAMYLGQSENLFSLYDNIKLALHYKHDKDKILYDLMWSLDNIKDFAQYQY